VTRPIVRDDAEAAAAAAAEILADRIGARIRTSGVVHVALAGGSTPRRAYELLAGMLPDWGSVHLWLGDERLVPGDDANANVRMIRDSLVAGLATSPILHPVATELGAVGARDAYEAALDDLLPHDRSGVPVLDIAFLGLGEDGHTASLFPDAPELDVRDRACVVVRGAPKPPPVRISLTMPVLRAARQRVVLATGAGKAAAVARALGEPTPQVPASLLPRVGTTYVLDVDAAALLETAPDEA